MIWIVVLYHKGTINLFQYEHSCHLMGKGQITQLPFPVTAIIDIFARSQRACDNECKVTGLIGL